MDKGVTKGYITLVRKVKGFRSQDLSLDTAEQYLNYYTLDILVQQTCLVHFVHCMSDKGTCVVGMLICM